MPSVMKKNTHGFWKLQQQSAPNHKVQLPNIFVTKKIQALKLGVKSDHHLVLISKEHHWRRATWGHPLLKQQRNVSKFPTANLCQMTKLYETKQKIPKIERVLYFKKEQNMWFFGSLLVNTWLKHLKVPMSFSASPDFLNLLASIHDFPGYRIASCRRFSFANLRKICSKNDLPVIEKSLFQQLRSPGHLKVAKDGFSIGGQGGFPVLLSWQYHWEVQEKLWSTNYSCWQFNPRNHWTNLGIPLSYPKINSQHMWTQQSEQLVPDGATLTKTQIQS